MLEVAESELDNAFIRRKKKALLKKFIPTQSKTIEEANCLVVYLLVLERATEAYDLLVSYAEKIPYDQNRRERWEATCKAILLLAFIERSRGNDEVSDKLNQVVLSQDYEVGRDDKVYWFWRQIEGFNAAHSLIVSEGLKQNDTCLIYAESYQEFVYYKQLMPAFGVFKKTDDLLLQANFSDLNEKLFRAISGKGS